MRVGRMARAAAVDRYPSRQRRRSGQPTREPRVPVPELPLADRHVRWPQRTPAQECRCDDNGRPPVVRPAYSAQTACYFGHSMDVYQRRRLVALSALAAVFILLVLLVRSSGASGVQGSVLTKEQYTSEADDACLQANTSLVGVDEADAQQAASDKAEILAGELSAIQSLSAPEDDANTLNSFLDALDKQVKAYEDQAT